MSADEKSSFMKMILNMDGTNIPFTGFVLVLDLILAPGITALLLFLFSFLTFKSPPPDSSLTCPSSSNLLFPTLLHSQFHVPLDNNCGNPVQENLCLKYLDCLSLASKQDIILKYNQFAPKVFWSIYEKVISHRIKTSKRGRFLVHFSDILCVMVIYLISRPSCPYQYI